MPLTARTALLLVLNFRNAAWDFLSSAAYGVYILHFVLLAPAVYAYMAVLGATGTPVTVTYCASKSGFFGITELLGWQLMLGWLFCVALVNLALWPFAFYVRMLPGFRRVL